MKRSAYGPCARARLQARSKFRVVRSGITLIEMLVAMTVSLILVYALLHAFAYVISFVTSGRALVETSGQLRGASFHLTNDLRHLTTPVRAWPDRESMSGYFEYIDPFGNDERPLLGFQQLDSARFTTPFASNSSFGDFDDILAMTVSSKNQPFVGQVIFNDPVNGPTPRSIDAPYAEVVWWCVWADDGDSDPGVNEVTLYRRVLLIRPDIAPYDANFPGLITEITGSGAALWDQLEFFYDHNDISVRPEVRNINNQTRIRMWANSLTDLTRRENRFCHRAIIDNSGGNFTPLYDTTLPGQFPYEMKRFQPALMPSLVTVVQGLNNVTGLTNDQLGEDVMQSHIVAFDIKAYDPNAPLTPSSAGFGEVLSPHDPGYANTNGVAVPVVSAGAFVDLYYMNYVQQRAQYAATVTSNWTAPTSVYPTTNYTSIFSGPPNPRSGINNPAFSAPTYDPWSYHYEQDGIDQDGDNVTDEGTNGFDDDNNNGVDDPNERETAAPYAAALRGLRVSIRVNEPDSRQVKQTTVEQDFTPE